MPGMRLQRMGIAHKYQTHFLINKAQGPGTYKFRALVTDACYGLVVISIGLNFSS
jgi:hypothetical protein